MHGGDDAEFREAEMGDLLVNQRLRHDADDMAAATKRRIGQYPHEAGPAAAIHEHDPLPRQTCAQIARGRGILWPLAGRGPAKHTNA